MTTKIKKINPTDGRGDYRWVWYEIDTSIGTQRYIECPQGHPNNVSIDKDKLNNFHCRSNCSHKIDGEVSLSES